MLKTAKMRYKPVTPVTHLRTLMLTDRLIQRQIILDDKTRGYRPKLEDLRRITLRLPKGTKVIGFGHYGFVDMFYLAVESEQFAYTAPLNISAKRLLEGTVNVLTPPNMPTPA